MVRAKAQNSEGQMRESDDSRFILDPEAVGSADARSPESVFELATLLRIVRLDEASRNNALRAYWIRAYEAHHPLQETLLQDFCERGIIDKDELVEHLRINEKTIVI